MKQFHYRGARSIRGFTLIELMVVVAIIGILVGIAVPAYQDSVRKSRRGQAKADLAEVAQAMERFYTVNNTYVGADLAIIAMTQSPKVGDARYTISFSGATTASTFVLRAQPTGGQVGDKCGTLTLSNTGAKTPDRATMPECWNLQ
ncbi:type IV pilin protein [Lysobacter capsici]|uniref:type IV pilin protein n=1 Tax=Lysobacter capsici TaxID=435897 RepID=UPI00287B7684|nr:type IV pilin protein [Lysobacter capsici]WND82172.1 type IV pilin protein [Lysobacter capsici]WND87367.1 type IV pilin protein [Lysobacter capsici]